jgi:uncharacterized membrane protein
VHWQRGPLVYCAVRINKIKLNLLVLSAGIHGNIMLRKITFGCHGIPERCFTIHGKHMPFCAWCLVAHIGHIWAAINFFVLPMLPLIFSPIGLAIMFIDWLLQNKYRVYHSNVSRLITGIIGGYSVGLVIWWVIKIVVSKI